MNVREIDSFLSNDILEISSDEDDPTYNYQKELEAKEQRITELQLLVKKQQSSATSSNNTDLLKKIKRVELKLRMKEDEL